MGLVIGTYGSVPYIHLQLEAWRRHCAEMPLLIHEDASPHAGRLRELCAEYGAEFFGNCARWGHVPGDLLAYINGLAWARQAGVELLVKFSRRWIPLTPWQAQLGQLAFDSQFATFSGRCLAFGFGFRTECLAVHVPTWVATDALRPIRETLARIGSLDPSLSADQQRVVLVEAVVHRAAQRAHEVRCVECEAYESKHPMADGCGYYAEWPLLGTNRREPRAHVLWHNASRSQEYHRALIQWGIDCYAPEDFIDPSANLHG